MYKVLDCTLRDGGYYNHWDFDDELTLTYFRAMQNIAVAYVEIGYRNHGLKGYEGKYFYCPEFVLERCRTLMPGKKLAIMLNEREVSPADVAQLLAPCKGLVDMVRIAVAPARFTEAVELSRAIRKEGFEAAINLMYMSKLMDGGADKILNQLPRLEDTVNYFSLVDSYGGVYPDEVSRLITQCKALTQIPVGFHGHNNIELAFANALAAVEAGCDIIDATIAGMGRGAGNLRTELLLTHQASRNGVEVDFNALADVVTKFEDLRHKHNWGTNLPYMVSGSNSLPQKEVMDLVSKRTYSINSIIRGLDNQSKGQEDNIKLSVFESTESYDTAIVIGGGPAAVQHAEAIKKFISQHTRICLIHASAKNCWAYEQVPVSQYFCLVGNEGHRLEAVFSSEAAIRPVCILPPFPRKMGTYIPECRISESFELAEVNITDAYKDAHTALALQLAKELKVSTLYLAGYDGYLDQQINQKEQDLLVENNQVFSDAAAAFDAMISLTPSNYKNLKVQSVYSLIY